MRSGGLDTILAAEANGRTRLVLNLDRMLPYQTRVEGNSIIVTLGESGARRRRSRDARGDRRGAQPPPRPATGRSIQSLDFRRGSDGAGRLIVKLSDPRTPINLRQQGNQILVDFVGADAAAEPAAPLRRRRLRDAGARASTRCATGNGTRLVIAAAGDFEQLAYQSDDQYVIEVQPAAPGAGAGRRASRSTPASA